LLLLDIYFSQVKDISRFQLYYLINRSRIEDTSITNRFDYNIAFKEWEEDELRLYNYWFYITGAV